MLNIYFITTGTNLNSNIVPVSHNLQVSHYSESLVTIIVTNNIVYSALYSSILIAGKMSDDNRPLL
jgi:hypothetical protein